jgi:hypothetical protein
VLEEQAEPAYIVVVKSPKSIASPVDAIVI